MKRAIATAAVLLVLSGSSQTFPTTWYRVQDLGTLGGSFSDGTSINDLDQIVGYSKDGAGVQKAFLWQNGSISTLPEPVGSTEGWCQYITNAGTTAGYSVVAGKKHSYIRKAGVLADIGTLGGTETNLLGFIESENGAGNSRCSDGHWAPFKLVNGAMTKLVVFGDHGGLASGVNSAGFITGNGALSSTGPTHAFFWDNGTVTDIGGLGGSTSTGFRVNTSRQVAGYAATASGATHAFLWSPSGGIKDLGTLGGQDSTPTLITEDGRIYGWADTAQGVAHAVLWQDCTTTDMNALINPAYGWTLNAINNINNSGHMTGWGTIGGESHAFLMTPALAGDANIDGKVDGIDLAMWQVNYDPIGHPTNTWLMGDWNGDNKIDGADLALWQQNYSPLGYSPLFGAEGLSPNFASVPEPATVALLLAAGPILAFFRRRRVARNSS